MDFLIECSDTLNALGRASKGVYRGGKVDLAALETEQVPVDIVNIAASAIISVAFAGRWEVIKPSWHVNGDEALRHDFNTYT